nr:hypothetical protein [Tanacetum cinerariifolium]
MVAYLSKSDASEGFDPIIDFLNGSSIKYALKVNLNIYVSCIKQFWTTVAVKQVNAVTRLQALVDKKKVVVTEAAIRKVLRLDDAEGVDCLPNEEIVTELARMGYEKPSTKLTGFSGVETPLFEEMLVKQKIEEEGDADEHVKEVTTGDDAHGDDSVAHGEVPTVQQTPPQSPQVQPPSPPPQPQQAADFPMSLLQETLDACAALTRRVEHLEYDKLAQALEITKLKKRVKKLEKRNKGRMIAEMDKDDDVVLMDDKEEDKKVEEAKEDETKPAEVQEVIDVVTTAKLITEVVTAASETVTAASAIIPTIDHVKLKAKEDPFVKRYQAIKRKPQTEAQARKNMMMYLKNVAGFKLDYFKGMSYNDICPIFEAKFNSNVDFLLKTKEQMEEKENRALQMIIETLVEKASKRRKLNEEVEDLKRHLQIVPNKDDDVYTEATPLARKVPIVDYEIIEINNKPYYKIIKADGTHQLYINFLTLLRNFDREDLEAL